MNASPEVLSTTIADGRQGRGERKILWKVRGERRSYAARNEESLAVTTTRRRRRRLSRDIRGNWDPGARLEASSIMVPVTPASEMEVMIGREVDPTRKCWEVGS